MMNRRELLSGFPLLLATPMAVQAPRPGMQVREPDPVLDQLRADIEELVTESRSSDDNTRLAAGRALEAALSVLEVHLKTQYEPKLRAALAEAMKRRGRNGLADWIVSQSQRPGQITRAGVLALLDDFDKHGLNVRAAIGRNALRGARQDRARGPFQRIVAKQGGWCRDIDANISWLELQAAVYCTWFWAEPTPLFEALCIGTGIAIAPWLALKLVYC